MKYLKYKPFLIAFIAVITFILCLLNQRYEHNWGGDFALYIHQAKSITEGNVKELAVINRYIVENSSVHTFSPVLYPWGFPLLITPAYYVFGTNYTAFKVLEAIFFIGALAMMFFTFKRNDRLNFPYSFFFLSIIAFNKTYIQATNEVLSGIPFLCFSYLGLYLILKSLEEFEKVSWRLFVALGFVLFFCFNIRTEGIGLFLALFIGQLQFYVKYKKREKNVLSLFSIPYITAFVLHLFSKSVLPSGFTSHFNYRNLVNWETTITNIRTYLEWLNSSMFQVAIIPFFIYIVLGIALIGILTRVKKNLVLITYFVFLITLFIIWPFRELRYLYSIYPLVLYFFIQGICFFYEQSKRNQVIQYAGVLLILLCLTTNLTNTLKSSVKQIGNDIVLDGPETPDSKEMFSFIVNNTDKKAVIAFFKPRVMNLYTDRISLALFNSMNELNGKADYYVENKRMGQYFQIPVGEVGLKTYPSLKEVFSNKEFIVYKIVK